MDVIQTQNDIVVVQTVAVREDADISKLKDFEITPNLFGAKPNDPTFDNTDAINTAFASGKDIYGNANDIFYVKGIINSNGQKAYGGWKIASSRSMLGVVNTLVNESEIKRIRMLYVESAYDLTELLFIKSLGFNMIMHYGKFNNYGYNDSKGTLEQLLKNAQTAGLKVNIGTQNERGNKDLVELINATKGFPATFGYGLYDEPVVHQISVEQQNKKIKMVKTLTNKPLSFVDYEVEDQSSNPKISNKYDIAFVNSYSKFQKNGTLNDRIGKDISKMKRDFKSVSRVSESQRVVPVISAFLYNDSFYTSDIKQIIPASNNFSKIGDGSFGAFIWDGYGDVNIKDRVKTNKQLQNMLRDLNKQ